MTKKILVFMTIISSILIVLQSCKKEKNEVSISSHNQTESHNMGQNCMSCHISGGSGEGWFNIAGTVYDSLQTSTVPNTTIKLYTGPNGTGSLKETIQVDGLGNFFSTNNIDFGSGLYPAVTGTISTKFMSTSITTGQCNSCHGVSTIKIWAK